MASFPFVFELEHIKPEGSISWFGGTKQKDTASRKLLLLPVLVYQLPLFLCHVFAKTWSA
jgi:hypothetical protein